MTLPVPLGSNPLSPGQATSVSCVSSTFCMVVGFSGNDAAAFAVLWNGSTWLPEPVAVPPGGGAFSLHAVDCLSPTDCQAVGQVQGTPLNEQWNGTSWSILPSQASGLAWLNGVSCSDSNDCMAIGYDTAGALASEQWNGSEWSRVSIPNEATGSEAQSLTSVSCPSASSCVAVGWHSFQVTPTTGGEAPIVDSWNGSSWSTNPIPINLVAGLQGNLNGVDCYSVGDCVAVGGPDPGTGPGPALVLSSVNGKWSQADNPPTDSNGQGSTLLGLSCVSGWACVTVGTAGVQTGDDVYFADGSVASSDAPIATITSPSSGTTYTPDQIVPTVFTCSEGAFGPGLSSCLDSNGSSSPGFLDTSSVGSHTYSVTATSTDGVSDAASMAYLVANPPSATITAPPSGRIYAQNQVVPTSFTCSDGTGGPGISTCVDSNGVTSPGQLDTTTPGSHVYSVIATSKDGLSHTTSVPYVVGSPAPTITTNPLSQSGYVGGSLTFTAGANGTPTPTVVWQVSTDNGTSWMDVPGFSTTTVTTPALTVAQNGSEIRAVFTNPAGSATTTPATITVLLDVVPNVTNQPTS